MLRLLFEKFIRDCFFWDIKFANQENLAQAAKLRQILTIRNKYQITFWFNFDTKRRNNL